MANFKMVFRFSNQGQGWSEIYYCGGSDYDELQGRFNTLPRNFMVGWRSTVTVCKSVTFYDLGQPRSSLLIPINLAGAAGASGDEGPDVTSTSAVYTLNASASGAKRKVWLRGLPDISVMRNVNTGIDAPDPTFLQFVQTYLNRIKNQLQGAIRSLVPVARANYIQVISAQQDPAMPGYTRLTLSANVPVGRRLIVTGIPFKTAPAMNGHYTVVAQTAPPGNPYTATIRYNPPSTWGAQVVLTPKGAVHDEAYDFNPITSFGFTGFWSRDTGKDAGLHRGRRTVTVRRAQ